MRVETLVSCVDKEETALALTMGLEEDAIIVNQTSEAGEYCFFMREGQIIIADDGEKTSEVISPDDAEETSKKNGRLQCVRMKERGVGLSRNTAMNRMDKAGEVCLFSDEDIRYKKGYTERIKEEYASHPEADMILFNVRVNPSRRTYWNDTFKRIRFYNYGRYPAYSISARKKVLLESGVQYSLLFGGGAKYSNGEDSLFLKDCLHAGLRIYASPVCLGEEEERPATENASTWFTGYHEKFFHDRGVLYAFLYGPMKYVMAWVFLIRKRKTMCREISIWQAAKYMKEGIREAKELQ